MPHSTVGVNNPGRCDDFVNRKIDVVGVAYAYSNSTEPSKCAMHSILAKNSAEDGIRSICTTCPDHISWVYVFDICWDTNLLEMPFYLLLDMDTYIAKYHIP
eukprot:TRINITY_DN7092_c0_g1_i8.p1 TRINITY_DN7092_c0_g1~~TRINITY_DN7092_c0_g1_i8.p1  ORF type:complete len:102 (-),score=9.04 TRINITY_DN7092_c0_g1_i8:243-548(-)